MPISFPASPTSSQLYTYGGRTYRWTGTAWEFVAASGEDALLRSLFVPAAPTGLTVTAGNAQATLSWTAPSGVIAQAPITDYREQFSTDNGATWTTFTAAASTATGATVTGLTNGTAVRFRVAAVNGVGVGAYTAASSSVTPAAALSAPVLTRTGCYDGTVSYSWTTIAGATTYRLQSNNNDSSSLGTWADVQANGSTSASIGTGSNAGQWFRVRAENATMQSAYSSPVQANCDYNG